MEDCQMPHLSRSQLEKCRERLIVALDVPAEEQAMEIVAQLGDAVKFYKVGMELYYGAGPAILKRLKEYGKDVFLDLKMHDIPNTVSKAGKVLARLGVTMFNVHVSGGKQMMSGVVGAARDEAKEQGLVAPKILGVTVLTSMGEQEFNEELGFPGTIEEKVTAWAKLAEEAGLDGIVASAMEAPTIKQVCGDSFMIVTPGVRPAETSSQDQKRVVTPKEAFQKGATHIVVGRPITEKVHQRDKLKVVNNIYQELSEVI